MAAHAGKRTVCTITVNSADEREVFRQRLPEDEYQFVELVERGRRDWLASACRQGVRCDLLVISGHFDSGTEFYSDRLAMRESLAVAEMERASCSESCPGLFSQLKEVYLFGCNTLNAQAITSTTPEAERSLVRSGRSPRRCAAAGARARSAPWREQSGSHAPHFHERAGHLRLFRARAARAYRRDAAEPLFRFAFHDRIGQRPREPEAPRPFRPKLDGCRRRSRRFRSGDRFPAGDLPIRRRSAIAGGETRLPP